MQFQFKATPALLNLRFQKGVVVVLYPVCVNVTVNTSCVFCQEVVMDCAVYETRRNG